MRTSKFVVLALVLLGVIAGVLVWQLGTPRELTYTQAVSQLDSLLKRISWSESIVTRKATVTVDRAPDLKDTLPDISKFELVVNPTVVPGEVAVEIFASVAHVSMAMGDRAPFVSGAGLNFLVAVLATFAQGDPGKMLADDVISAFEAFQRGVPFVALTTSQMRDSVQNDGSLDAFIVNRAVFAKAPAFQSGYAFIPYGIRQDSPLYGLGQLTAEKHEALRLFAQFAA